MTPGRIGIGPVLHPQAPAQFIAHLDRPGNVACRAFADTNDVFAHRTMPELAVECGHAGNLRGGNFGGFIHATQGRFGQIAVLRLDRLQNGNDRSRPTAFYGDNFIHRPEIDGLGFPMPTAFLPVGRRNR